MNRYFDLDRTGWWKAATPPAFVFYQRGQTLVLTRAQMERLIWRCRIGRITPKKPDGSHGGKDRGDT